MKHKAIILLGTLSTLAIAVVVVWPRFDYWRLTGSFAPIRKIEVLQHPVAVIKCDADGLHLADGRTVKLPGVSALPHDSPALREAVERGVEVRPDGRVWALVKIHHWCGNDPVREHVAQVDLSDMMMFLRIGHPTTTVPQPNYLAREPGGRFSQWGWNISEFLDFQSWQSLKHLSADTKNPGTT